MELLLPISWVVLYIDLKTVKILDV